MGPKDVQPTISQSLAEQNNKQNKAGEHGLVYEKTDKKDPEAYYGLAEAKLDTIQPGPEPEPVFEGNDTLTLTFNKALKNLRENHHGRLESGSNHTILVTPADSTGFLVRMDYLVFKDGKIHDKGDKAGGKFYNKADFLMFKPGGTVLDGTIRNSVTLEEVPLKKDDIENFLENAKILFPELFK